MNTKPAWQGYFCWMLALPAGSGPKGLRQWLVRTKLNKYHSYAFYLVRRMRRASQYLTSLSPVEFYCPHNPHSTGLGSPPKWMTKQDFDTVTMGSFGGLEKTFTGRKFFPTQYMLAEPKG
jgi:hypothetical protein